MKKKTMKRILAAMLTMVMLTGNLSVMASASQSEPPQATADEKPSVEIQGKVIKDQFGKLNGFFELALRVQTPENETFRDVAVAIEYDATVLQPVNWTAGKGETITLTGTEEYTVQQPAKKADGITTGVALTGDAVNLNKNLLYFHAESQKGVSLPDMTTLAVVRFYVNPDKGAFKLEPDGKTLKYNDAATSISDFIKFAPDVDAAGSPAGQALVYASGDNLFYYTPVTDTETVTVPGTTITLTAPKTVGTKVLAVDKALTAADPGYYSYTSNQLDNTKVKLDLTCGESFSKDGVDIDKLCTITYLDWSGETIGTQVVPQNADARDLVNKYVMETFIYPDLRGNSNYGSLARSDTYRGAYPHSGPNGAIDAKEAADGPKYPLTNKLDYVFFKRVLEQEKDTNNPTYPTWKVAEAYDTAYPYIHGWALVASSGDNWTTLGVGELENYDGATGSMPITDANKYFKPASFVDIKTNSLTVKAIYEPGEKLKKDFQYSVVGQPRIERYGYTASTEDATYAVKYQYERIYTDGYGVSRTREPAIKQGFTMDALAMDGNNGKSKPVYLEVKVDNRDIINVTLTPAGSVWQINYVLTDTYSTNFVLASERSVTGNSMNIPSNFDYDHFKYSTRQGSAGIVLQATLNTILTEASKAARGEANEFSQHWKLATTVDLNLRTDANGAEFTAGSLARGLTKIQAAVTAAVTANGGKDAVLTWHQLQYHIINSDNAGAGGIILPGGGIMSDNECKNAPNGHYKWCRLIDGCVVGNVITVETLKDLLTIVHDKNTASTDLLELTQVSGTPLWLRADESGTAFTNKAAFLALMDTIVTNAGANYMTLTWPQVQYALLNGGVIPTEEIAKTESNAKYFWRDGLTLVTDWSSFLKAAQGAYMGTSPAALNLLTLDQIANAPVYLRSDVDGLPYDSTSIEDFKAVAKKLISLAGENWAGITWEQAQYYIAAGSSGVTLPDQTTAQTESDLKYWWAGGGQVPTNLPTLLKAAQLANNGKPAALNGLINISNLTDEAKYLKVNFEGKGFAGIEEFKTTIKDAVKAVGINYSYNQLQYYLVREYDGVPTTSVSESTAKAERDKYYWWSDGSAAGSAVTISAGVPSNVNTLIDAAYRAEFNGNINAWANMDELLATAFRLIRPPYAGTEADFNALNKYDSSTIAEFKSDMQNMVREAITEESLSAYTTPAATWYQGQYYLLNKDYISKSDSNLPGDMEYWWLKQDKNPNISSGPTPLELLLDEMTAYKTGALTSDAFTGLITVERLNDSQLDFRRSAAGATYATQTQAEKHAAVRLLKLADDAWGSYAVGGKLVLTWQQVQYALINNALVAPGAAGSYIWMPLIYGGTLSMLSSEYQVWATEKTVETITSPDGLTITTTETVTNQDEETRVVTIISTVTTVTTSTTNTETEDITTTVTTKTVTTTVISMTGEPPVTTTTSETATKVERTPVEGEPEDPSQAPAEPAPPEGEPTEPEVPVEPETPTIPETPTDPEIPTTPETPTEPEVPTDPEPEHPSQAPAEPAPPEGEPTEPAAPATSDTGTQTEPLVIMSVSNSTQLGSGPLTYRWARPLGPLTKGAAARRLGDLYSGSYTQNPPAPSGAPPLVKGARATRIGFFDSGGGLPPAFPMWGTALSFTPWTHSIKAFPMSTLLAYLGGRTI